MKDVAEGTPAKKRRTSEGNEAKGQKKVSILCVTEQHSPDSTQDKRCNTPAPAEAVLLVSPQIPTHGTQQDSAASDLKQVLEKRNTVNGPSRLEELKVNSLQQYKMCKLPKYLNCKTNLLTWNAQQQLNANYNNVSPVTCLSCCSVKEESFRILPMSGCNLQHLRSATPQLVCNAS